jgi:hypothetical protein
VSQVRADENAGDQCAEVPHSRAVSLNQPRSISGRHVYDHPKPDSIWALVSGPGSRGQERTRSGGGRVSLTNLAPAQTATPIST